MTGVPRKPLPELALSRSVVDRAAARRALTPGDGGRPVRVLELRGELLPVREDDGRVVLAHRDRRPDDGPYLYLGSHDGVDHVARLTAACDDPGDGWAGLRHLGPVLDAADLGLATTAVAMMQWHAAVRFCARCGAPVQARDGGWLLRCTEGHDSYPQTSPAVIMSVVDEDDRLLLARGPVWGPRTRSVLAGFVEPGESLEHAVAREVAEEVGIAATEVRYEGNQPWPFPASLMIGFSCRASSTGLTLDPAEIAAAEWYSREGLRAAADRGDVSLPGPLSIAHHLVAQWYGGPPPGARPA